MHNADVFVVTPATANTLAKLAACLADNLLTNTAQLHPHCPTARCAPTINSRMSDTHGGAGQRRRPCAAARRVRARARPRPPRLHAASKSTRPLPEPAAPARGGQDARDGPVAPAAGARPARAAHARHRRRHARADRPGALPATARRARWASRSPRAAAVSGAAVTLVAARALPPTRACTSVDVRPRPAEDGLRCRASPTPTCCSWPRPSPTSRRRAGRRASSRRPPGAERIELEQTPDILAGLAAAAVGAARRRLRRRDGEGARQLRIEKRARAST